MLSQIKNRASAKLLQEIQLNVISEKKCQQYWNEHNVPILDSHVCTLNEDGNACEVSILFKFLFENYESNFTSL